MKISCQSCQAKYTIADEKVLGKIVKIRCKKCGATIVINGNETTAAGASVTSEEAPTNVYDYTGQPSTTGEQWTVNVADGDQRTMASYEIAAEFKTGVVTEETYCWKDGMSDWLPLREIDELYRLCTMGPTPSLSPDQVHNEAVPSHDAPAPGPNEGFLFGGGAAPSAPASSPPGQGNGNGNGAGAGLFGASPGAAARRQGRAGGDLFGGFAQAGGEDDVMTSAPAGMPQASNEPGKLTGQRNENSVLFSLNALTQNAPEEAKKTNEPPQGEASGLIDIRALSASMGGSSAPKAKSHVDDIMNLGGGGAFSAALAAPVLAPPAMEASAIDVGGGGQKPNKGIMYGLIGGGVAVALAIVIVATRGSSSKADTATTATAASASAVAAADTAPPAPTEAPAETAAPTATPPTAAAPGTGQVAAAAAPRTGGGGGGGGSHHSSAASDPVAAGNALPTPPPVAAAPAQPKSLADALKSAAGDTGGGGGSSAPKAGGSAPFDRGAAAAALGSVNVASCKKGDGPTGSGHVSVTFAPDGSVSKAEVDRPPFQGSPVGGCVAGKFRGAHIPAFSGGSVTVGKSFIIN